MFTRSREGKEPLLPDPEITKSERKRRKQKKRNNQPPEVAMGDQLENANRTHAEYENPYLTRTHSSIVARIARTSRGATIPKRNVQLEEQPQDLELSNHDEEAVNYVNPQ
ncbi:hypothetical protein Dimus_024817 [Dionaea muscipula]